MTDPTSRPKQELTFREVFLPIWRERKRVLFFSVTVALVTLGVNFLLPKYYRANAVILPETDKNKVGSIGQLAGLASLAGLNVPITDISRLYPVILSSESVITNVLLEKYHTEQFKDSVNLMQYFELDEGSPAKNLDAAIKELRSLLSVTYDNKTSVVSCSVEMREPQLAADVMNTALRELDLFLREKKINSAAEQRKWIESRLVQVEGELREAEEKLKDFRERNRKVGDSPQLMLQQDRLLREVQIRGTIDVELRKQAEIAKIDEIKQVSTITVLDEGRAPVRKERPKRATNAAIAFILTFAGASSFFAMRVLYGTKFREYIYSLRA